MGFDGHVQEAMNHLSDRELKIAETMWYASACYMYNNFVSMMKLDKTGIGLHMMTADMLREIEGFYAMQGKDEASTH